MLPRVRNDLKGMSKTVVYVMPSASAAVGQKIAWGDYPFGPDGSNVTGFFLGGLFYSSMNAFYRDKAFSGELQDRSAELEKMDIPSMMEVNLHQALSGVTWLRHVPYKVMQLHSGKNSIRSLIMHDDSKATIVVVPKAFIRDDAEVVGIIYSLTTYTKYYKSRVRIRELDRQTIESSIKIKYPDKYQHFNILTAPTTSAAALRLQYLFSSQGEVLDNALKVSTQRAGWKITCYLAESCAHHSESEFGM